MTQVLSLTTRDMESVVGPVHHHMSFDRSLRSRGSFGVDEDGRLSPSPLRTASGRKRAATISTADAKQAIFEPLSVSTNVTAQDVTRDIICLCTPAPKIPRPRNAFILYRQHHQSQVTADNPKLSNPEISKIIGDKWKHESEDIKETWKKLAEEEKQRHQQQYPNYRYQPRRGTKTQQSWTSTSPTDENGRCPKCHGRSISTPRTPSTPFATSPGGNYALASQSQPNLRRLDTALSRRSSSETSPTSTVPFSTQLPAVRDLDANEPGSPEAKRRRANAAGGYHAVVGPSGAYTTSRPSGDLGRTPPDTGPSMMRPYSGGSFSDIGSLPRSHAGPMPPPLRPSGMAPWTDTEQHSRRHSGFDESLRLPPLQTSIPPSPVRSPGGEGRNAGFLSTRLNVSPLREPRFGSFDVPASEPNLKQKLGMLSKISQLVPTPGRRNPRGEVRGAVIAVEGSNASLVDEIGRSLEKGMVACGEVSLKTWSDDSGHPNNQVDDKRSVAGGNQSEDDLFKSYSDTILSWRQKSRDIKTHVIGGRGKGAAVGTDAEKDTKIAEAQSTEACTPPEEDRSPTSAAKTPVALIKGGYSLTFSDAYASAMSAADKFSPLDHWHWMASMWRATVCPDLVVYVRDNNDKDDEFSQPGAVDVSRRMGLIVVKVAAGKALDEATERRMAFEVMEWLREGAYQDEVSPNWRSNSL